MVFPDDLRADAGENLVANSIACFGEFFGVDGLVAVLADEYDGIAWSSVGEVRDVDHGFVHGDGAAYGAARSADEYVCVVGEGSGVSVCVSDGEGRDFGGGLGVIGAAVADGGVFGEIADEHDACGPGGDGAEGGVFWDVVVGLDSVGDDAGSDGFVVTFGVFYECGAVCGVGDFEGNPDV